MQILPAESWDLQSIKAVSKEKGDTTMQEPGTASTSGPEGAIVLASPAWLRHGPKGMFGSMEAGLLIAREGGSISFVTQKEKVFEAERHAIGVQWPWWEFGGGVHLKVAGKIYRLSLASPARLAIPSGGIGGQVSALGSNLDSISGALKSGKEWKSYLKP